MIGAAANLCVAGECNTVKVAVARILWRDAQGIEGSIDLGATEVKIGRATECEIRTDDAMVSRNHARIAWGGGGYVVEDLQSANGVYFQEQRVASHLLKHGDAVRCGSLWLRFVDLASEMPRAAPQPLAAYHPGNTSATSGPSASPAPAVGGVGAPSPAAPLPAAPHAFPVAANEPRPPGPTSGMLAAVQHAPPALGASAHSTGEADVEIRVLRRRIEQLQTELRVYRTNKFSAESARRMEDLENDLSTIEIDRDQLREKLQRAEAQMASEAGSIKVKRALEIATLAQETTVSLHDVLSSLRIEVMAAEGEFDQYAHALPRSSFELIRQSLRDASTHCDSAREVLRKLRELAE